MENDNSKQVAERRAKLREKLADLEHRQWIYWTKKVMENTKTDSVEGQFVLEAIYKNWRKNHIPYSELTEEMKDYDREWADKVLELLP